MLLTGKEPAQILYKELEVRLLNLSPVPGLFVLYDPKDVPACWYLNTIKRSGEGHGIPVYARSFEEGADPPKERLGGMIVLSKSPYPISIPENLDVDGAEPSSFPTLYAGGFSSFPPHTPCTAEACVRLLDYYQIPLQGRHVVVLGRSLTVGRPLSMLLLQRDATVTVCHSKTERLAEICRRADILICATGKTGLVDQSCVSANQTVVNIGGDVKEEEVLPLVQNLCPLKGGIGALTTAVLFSHVVA